jgi:hypothetical protein
MSTYDEVLEANERYAASFGEKGDLALPPARHFAILTCMDARLDPAKYAGLSEGDAHVIRNAGGRASDDAIRSLIISYKLLGTQEWFVIHHSNCGMEFFTDDVMRGLLANSLETAELGADGLHRLADHRQQRTERGRRRGEDPPPPTGSEADSHLWLHLRRRYRTVARGGRGHQGGAARLSSCLLGTISQQHFGKGMGRWRRRRPSHRGELGPDPWADRANRNAIGVDRGSGGVGYEGCAQSTAH